MSAATATDTLIAAGDERVPATSSTPDTLAGTDPDPDLQYPAIAGALARGGVKALRGVPVVGVGARLVPGARADADETLLGRSVLLAPAVPPLFAELLKLAGATRRGEQTWSASLGDNADLTQLTAIIDAIPDGLLLSKNAAAATVERNGNLLAVSNSRAAQSVMRVARNNLLSEALRNSDHALVAAPTGQQPPAGVRVVINVSRAQLWLRVVTEGFSLSSPHGVQDLSQLPLEGQRDPKAVPVHVAVELLRIARDQGIPTLDRTPAAVTDGGLPRTVSLLERAVLGRPVPGRPGEAELVVGTKVRGRARAGIKRDRGKIAATDVVTAEQAARVLDDGRGNSTRVLHPAVADIAAMAQAAPAGRDGLRSYQDHCVSLHAAAAASPLETSGFVNASSVGLGKTVMTLAAFTERAAKVEGWRGLVVVPAAIRSQWRSEAAVFFPQARTHVLYSRADVVALEEELDAAGTDPLLVIGSYDMARRAVDDLAALDWHDLVCDEAQVLKNSSSARSKALWQLRAKAQVAVGLTGTPIDKSVDDLGAIAAWARNDADLWRGQKLSRTFTDLTDAAERQRFRQAVGPMVFRRDRSEVADELPAVSTEVVLLDPSEPERRLATAARTELKRIYTDLLAQLEQAQALNPEDDRYSQARAELASARGAMLGGVTLARMAASDPVAVANSDSPGATLLRSSGLVEPAIRKPGTKRAQIVELAADLVAQGEAVLIFTDFSTVADALVTDLTGRDIAAAAVTGKQNAKVRNAAIDGFQNGEVDVLVLTSAGQEGLNLQRASTLIHMELPWTPSTIVQRNGRANRIGASKTLQVLIPLMAGTIEERVASVVVPRAITAAAALDEGRTDTSQTELGMALHGLADAVSEVEGGKADSSLLATARQVLDGS